MTRSTRPPAAGGLPPDGYTDVELPSAEDEDALDAAWASVTDEEIEASVRYLADEAQRPTPKPPKPKQ